MLACWVEDPNGDAFKKHLARVPDYLWVSEDGMTMQVKIDSLPIGNHWAKVVISSPNFILTVNFIPNFSYFGQFYPLLLL